jgi:hypothetical protein
MKRILTFLAAGLLLSGELQAQTPTPVATGKKGVLYMAVGTNLSYYTRSDISFKTSTSDFTLYDVRARDDRGFLKTNGGAPQYTYQIGYYFVEKNFGVEFNFDHIKYFVIPNQVVRAKGTMEGQPIDKDTALTPGFVQFEHSDGANYALFNFVKWKPLSKNRDGRSTLDLMWKAGAGMVIPKTNSTILGRKYDEQYRVSGYVVALEAGLRYTFLKNLYVAPSVKGAYANYTRFKIGDGFGSQRWFGAHFVVVIGGQLNFRKK